MSKQKDNSTLSRKVALRLAAVKRMASCSVVLETHGGYGRLAERCYFGKTGIVFEKDRKKAEHLAVQRPGWRVYEADCIKPLGAGLGADMSLGLIDLDPYGSPFDVMEAIFCGERREFAPVVQLVVNDGLRQKVGLGGAWHTERLKPLVRKYGNDLYPVYLEVARELTEKIVAGAGFRVANWAGYYCGAGNNMTHYWATLARGPAEASDAAVPAAGCYSRAAGTVVNPS